MAIGTMELGRYSNKKPSVVKSLNWTVIFTLQHF